MSTPAVDYTESLLNGNKIQSPLEKCLAAFDSLVTALYSFTIAIVVYVKYRYQNLTAFSSEDIPVYKAYCKEKESFIEKYVKENISNYSSNEDKKFSTNDDSSLNDICPIAIEDSIVHMCELLMPAQANPQGYAYGGILLSWMDLLGGICATRHAKTPCLTGSINAVNFLFPIRLGDMIHLSARVTKAWKKSLEVEVILLVRELEPHDNTKDIEKEKIAKNSFKICCHAFFTFVAMNVSQIPPIFSTDEQIAIDAEVRKEMRMKDMHKSFNIECPHSPSTISGFYWGIAHTKPSEMNPEQSINSLPSNENRICMSNTYTEMTKLILPQHANPLGITFGGQILQWMEHAASLAAASLLFAESENHSSMSDKLSKCSLLTLGMDAMTFLKPSKVGSILRFKAIVTQIFNSSIEVYVSVETLQKMEFSGSSFMLTNDGFLSFLVVDEFGEKLNLFQNITLPANLPSQVALQKDSFQRRQARLTAKAAIQNPLFKQT